MKWFPEGRLRRLFVALPLAGIFAAGYAARGELAEWIQDIEGAGRFEAVFFKSEPLPDGAVTVRRPPAESRNALNDLVAKAPADAELLLMRARVEEEQLDFAAAEADWKKRADLLPDKAAGQLELADFYHRRLRPQDEVAALALVARAPATPSEKLLPVTRQHSWSAFERVLALLSAHSLSATITIENYRAWIARYPQEASVYSRYFDFLLAHKQFTDAGKLIVDYQKAFPEDKIFPVEAQAWLEYRRGSADQALALYDQSFQPLWPPELVQAYFSLLKQTHHLRDFLTRARALVNTRPDDLSAAARVFYYYQQQGNLAEAQRALLEYRLHKERANAPWTAEQLWTLGQLFEGIHNYDEAARCYYALYSLPGAGAAFTEKALAGMINLLLTAPERPIRFGSEDFSLLRDIGTLDAYPGFLNGIVSLLLNSQQPAVHYTRAESASVAYFHRARAAELLPLLDSRFPRSPARAELHAKLLEVYATYGANDGVIRDGREFLSSFPKAPQRVHVALLLADALARKNRVEEELAAYDSLLAELAARADHVPLGEQAAGAITHQPARAAYPLSQAEAPPSEGKEETEGETSASAPVITPVPRPAVRQAEASGARSPEYARVLERYISRLVALKRPFQVLSLFNREIAQNPGDPGLYERLALFLDQNRLGQGIELVYRQAIKQFPGRTWYQKLARWYLRQRRRQDFENLSRQVVSTFAGSDLQKYFQAVVAQPGIDAQLYLELNLYAHERFPHNLAFVNNLLSAYSRPETGNATAWLALIRQHWYDDDNLRARYFAFLSSNHRLEAELQAIRQAHPEAAEGHWQEFAVKSPAAAQFISEAELWRSHFEAAAPVAQAVAAVYPTDNALGERAASLFRSLAAFDPNDTEIAAGIEENLSKYRPGDSGPLTRIGEIYADREMFDKSRPYWNRIAELAPGKSDGYLEAATVFWDYFLFDDTLRLLDAGRKKLGRPSLYAYEAGAVSENERNYHVAVQEYLKGALAAEGDSPARARLLQLVRRPRIGGEVEQATARIVTGPNPDWNAVSLRIAVLQALGRREDLQNFLLALTESSNSLEMLERIDPVAMWEGFDNVHTRGLERRATLATDPVEHLRLQLELARFQESKGNLEEARRSFDSIYHDNATLLGVVRATVDFYWRNKLADPAIDTLLQASKVAYPALAKQFVFEATRKATEAKEYARARELLGPLLEGDPYNSEYLAAMADTFAREGNDQALRDFYLAKIQAYRDAPLSTEERTQRIAELRRGLIPALTRLKDDAGAVAQYIEILNRYPEDEGLAQEASAYAERHGRSKQLLDYYVKATADSPKDYRWPMVLARVQTYFEDYPAAIASYTKAAKVRPDRSDLLIARAALEERLMRFDEAVQTYTQVYDLTYQNPQWMEKVAELRARQGQTEPALQALKKAKIEGRPEKPEIFFETAARLETWNMLPQAREFAGRGVSLAGPQLLTDPGNIEGSKTYATVMTRLRHYDEAFARLEKMAQAAKVAQFTPNLQAPLQAMGQVVRTYFTPEEKTAFANFLETQKAGMSEADVTQDLLPLVATAGLVDLEARWRHQLMMADPRLPEVQGLEARLVQLQEQRMKFDELGAQLEQYWSVYPQVPGKDAILERAADIYRRGGNTDAEFAALSKAFARQGLSGGYLTRYLELLLARDPQRLVALAGSGGSELIRNAASNVAVASGNRELALAAITARGSKLAPVWSRAYTGLVGLYYADPSPRINTAFQTGLGTDTVGERVGKRVDRNQQLAGNTWFYYGSRYGEYLAVTRQGDPEDYLPAMLEGAPANPDAYSTLADYYQDVGESEQALADYAHTLELAAKRGEVHDRMALILWQQGKRDDAVEHWRAAFQAYLHEENDGRVRPSYWENVRRVLEHVGERKILPQVRTDADQVLRTYVHRNGSYQVDDLLHGAFVAPGDAAAGTEWIIDLARSAPNPLSFLTETVDARWLPKPQQEPILRRILQLAENGVAQAQGEARSAALETLRTWQMCWVGYLLDAHRTEEAQTAFNALPEEVRKQRSPEVVALEIRLAAQSGTLDATLARYQGDTENTPPFDALQSAAAALRADGNEPAARRVQEFVYTREIAMRNLAPANFLGLAEIRMQSGDLPQAVALLRRMNLVAGEPFVNLRPAADLLVKNGHPAEALEFLTARVEAVPWDADARLVLAKAQLAANHDQVTAQKLLSSVSSAPEAPYATRAAAAQVFAGLQAPGATFGSGELDWLAKGGSPDAASAEQPGYFFARVEAAKRATDPATRVRLLLGSVAIVPQDNSPRIPLFHAAAAINKNELAYSAIEPLLDQGGGYYQSSYAAQNVGGAEAYAEVEADAGAAYAESFLARVEFTSEEKTTLAAQLAEVLEKLHRLPGAARYWTIAAALAPSGPTREGFQKRLDATREAMKVESQDSARRPVVSTHLEQKGLVRPRLKAKSKAAGGTLEGGGGR